MNQIMGGCKSDILFIKYDVLRNTFDVIAVNTVVAVHIHIGNGGSAVADLQVADVQTFFGQSIDHPFAVGIGAGGADNGSGNTQLLQVHAGVHAVAGGVAAVHHFTIDVDIDVNTVVADHCGFHVLISCFYYGRQFLTGCCIF